MLTPWKEIKTNLDSVLKSRDIALPTKVSRVKPLVFPVVMYGCENWTIKRAEHWRIDSFKLRCRRRPWEGLESPLESKEIKPVNPAAAKSLQSCPTLCNHVDCSSPGFPVHYQVREFTQTHLHRVNDAIQPAHPRSSPSPPAPNPSQHQSLFQWVSSSHQVVKVLEIQLQHQSFQWIFRIDFL